MHIACAWRIPQDLEQLKIPHEIAKCFQATGKQSRLALTTGNKLFWPTAAFVLDVFNATGGKLSDASNALGISTGNLVAFLRSHRNLLAAAQAIRHTNNHAPLR